MKSTRGFQRYAVGAFLISLAITAALTPLVATELISPAWLFAGPAVGTLGTSVAVGGFGRRGIAPRRSRGEGSEIVRRFEVLDRQVRAAEAQVNRWDFEISRTLQMLKGGGQFEGMSEYLAAEQLIAKLRSMEQRRSNMVRLVEQRRLEHAEAEGQLIAAGYERGIRAPEGGDLSKLARLVASPTEAATTRD